MEWISIDDNLPPKNEAFLALTTGLISIMEWKERDLREGWYGFYCPCACCGGYCSDKFKYWMPLPSPPKTGA